ncbi:MAG TPA: Hpt domain-containing protein, partial [Holophaga sp.]|nr:Hpt domain-containing protein [Holophaga sp.]
MDLNQIKQTFILEAQELLAAMEEALLAVEGEVDPTDSVNAMFRAVHTIKGSAGLFGLDAIVKFAHAVESVLDRVRGHSLALSKELVGILLECHDHLAERISGLPADGSEEAAASEAGNPILERLVPYLEGTPRPSTGVASREPAVQAPGKPKDLGPAFWHISIRFSPEVFRNGMDPTSFIRFLGTLGKVVHLRTVHQSLPMDDTFDPEVCYLGIELDLDSEAERAAIEDVFEFIRDDGLVRIIPPHAKVEEYLRLIRELPEEERFLGEMLVAGGCITRTDLEEALRTQKRE